VKSAVETLNPTRVKLTVEVTYDELKPSLDAAYKTIAGQVNIPGFRKGKVPPRIIDQRVGKGVVLEEAVNEALPHFYAKAVEESDVRPLGRPSVDVTDIPDPATGGDLKFTAEVDVRPQIDLPDLTSVQVTVDDVEVSDADVDERLESLRERFGTLTTVDRAAADGDFVSIDISAEIDGNEIDSVKGISYQIGSGTMLEGMDTALPGMTAGETKTFASPLAGGDRAGDEANVTVTLQAVKERNLPALDDDFAQLASEFDSLDELRADVRGQVEQMKKYQQGIQARERLLEQLISGTEVPVPDGVVEDEVHRHLEAESRLEDDEHRAEVETETREGFKAQLLLDAIAESEKVQVGQQELVEYLVMSAQQYGMEPGQFIQAVEQSGQIAGMVSEVARRKALAEVLSRATVKDASGNPVDLEALNPRPTPEQLAAQAVAAADAPAPAPAAAAVPKAADPTALPTFDLPEAD
jgi:trigger factor